MTFSDSELKAFESLLRERSSALTEVQSSAREASETVELDQARVGRLSRMDALQGQAMARESGRRRELELKKIDAALARLDSGDYGYCLRCGEPILTARLRLDPSATVCVACAHKLDR